MPTQIDAEARRILAASKTNRTLAIKELIGLVLKDDMLLRELVAPYLRAIAGQTLDRVSQGEGGVARSASKSVKAPAAPVLGVAAKAIAKDLKAGYNPMRATAPNAPELGVRPAASGRHVSTLKLLAAAYQVKRGQKV